MAARDSMARIGAGVIGALALVAMIPPTGYALASSDGPLWGLLGMLRAFTILTNGLVGIAFLRIAFKGPDAVSPLVLGGLMLAIMLVGVVFNLLLDHMAFETVWAWLGDRIHHRLVPVLVPLWWLVFAAKGRFGWSMPLAWMLYPLGYSALIIVTAQLLPAAMPNRYIYFFMDGEALGWPAAIANMAIIAGGFAAVGWLVVGIDRLMGRRAG